MSNQKRTQGNLLVVTLRRTFKAKQEETRGMQKAGEEQL